MEEKSKIIDIFKCRLKGIRKEHGLSQERFSWYINSNGVDCVFSTYKNWERGVSLPQMDTMVGLAKLFEVDLEYLLGLQGEKRKEYKRISDYTGLSLEATEKLFEPNARHLTGLEMALGLANIYDQEKSVLSRLIIENSFWKLLGAISDLETIVRKNQKQLGRLSPDTEDPVSLLVAMGNDKRVEELEIPSRRYLIGIMFANLLEELLTTTEPFPETEWEDCTEE